MSTTMRNNLRDMMAMAWSFVRQYGYTMSEAMKVAWLNIKLRKAMMSRIVKFIFEKVDGSTRIAYGTLKSDLVPPTGDGRKPSPNVQVYYDCEKESWRCYKRAQLLQIC